MSSSPPAGASPEGSARSGPPIFLSVVMPAYNEAATVEQVVLEHAQFLKSVSHLVPSWEIICLDDASTDTTWQILDQLSTRVQHLRVLRHTQNQGIAVSFADLYKAARGSCIYATATDGQWPASNLRPMLEVMASGAELVVGVRLNRRQVYTPDRQLVSLMFNLLPRLVFGVDTVDAGSIKLGIRELFGENLVSDSPFVEAERIIRARRLGYSVAFVPIDFLPRGGGKASGASWNNLVASARDALRCLRAYGFSPPGRPGPTGSGPRENRVPQ